MKKLNNKGFSLVELIIVIAIMVVLIGLLAPQFVKYVEKSKESTDVQNLDSIVTVVQAYLADQPSTDFSVAVEDGVFKITFTGKPDDFETKNGVSNVKVKGTWTAALSANYSATTGAITYAGTAKYIQYDSTTGTFVGADN